MQLSGTATPPASPVRPRLNDNIMAYGAGLREIYGQLPLPTAFWPPTMQGPISYRHYRNSKTAAATSKRAPLAYRPDCPPMLPRMAARALLAGASPFLPVVASWTQAAHQTCYAQARRETSATFAR